MRNEQYKQFNCYSVLSIEFSATPNEVKSAWRKVSLKTHPDRGGSKEEKGRDLVEPRNENRSKYCTAKAAGYRRKKRFWLLTGYRYHRGRFCKSCSNSLDRSCGTWLKCILKAERV